jgi:hypothetical protein
MTRRVLFASSSPASPSWGGKCDDAGEEAVRAPYGAPG